MTTILCFGDSNTWGADPARLGERFDRATRWTGLLQAMLGPTYYILEEGMSGRTTLWDDPIEGYTNGRDYLIPCLKSHKPVDLVMLMLGTNDLQRKYRLSAREIADSAAVLVKTIQQSECGPNGGRPQVLLICPPPLGRLQGFFIEVFGGSEATSYLLADEYARVAQLRACHFLDAGQIIESSPVDGLHFDAPDHQKLAHALAKWVLTMVEG